jgi:two-component system response regulator HydG
MNEKVKILVVDDDSRMVRTICDILNVNGYETVSAATGEEAVEKALSTMPDCILMDIKMPGMDGVTALKLIRKSMPGLPIVLMSAYATEEQVREAISQGAQTVLGKPIDIQAVLSFLSLLRKEESILVVDDDPVFCKTLHDILHGRGFSVKTEIDPGKALDRLDEERNLVVILDLKLGAANGVDILKDIRAKYPSKPVVMVTGYGEEMADSIRMGFKIGAYTCLYKPLEMEQLFAIIDEISRGRFREVLNEQLAAKEGRVNG